MLSHPRDQNFHNHVIKGDNINPPTVNSAHVIYEIAVNCGKNVVNRGKFRGKSTNLEVVLFFRIRMCLLLCLFVAVSIFQCSISGFLEF